MNSIDPTQFLRDLVQCPSVTPRDAGALDLLEHALTTMGFEVERPVFSEDGTPDVENLYARLGSGEPCLMFAGHTDVVPAGDEAAWTHPPFAAEIENGVIYGRGAVDMKGGIAAFVAAVSRFLAGHGKPRGSISLVITGDEEGPSVNGTDKLLRWAAERGERWDGALVGEPTNPTAIGDAVKIGRRGSVSGRITVTGIQGHSAYPELAENPVDSLLDLARALIRPAIDEGSERFQPTRLVITSIDVGNRATNVIPNRATLAFNVRFNDLWDGNSIKKEIERRLTEAANYGESRAERDGPARFDLEWIGRVSPVFVTRDRKLVETISEAVRKRTGGNPALSTGGGTSDARFIRDYCPVVEFGLVGQTMHQVDERVASSDLELLTSIYETFLEIWFGQDR